MTNPDYPMPIPNPNPAPIPGPSIVSGSGWYGIDKCAVERDELLSSGVLRHEPLPRPPKPKPEGPRPNPGSFVRRAFGVTVVATLGLVGLAAPAQAAPICAVGSVCLWDNINFGGGKKSFTSNSEYRLSLYGWNDRTSSICNNRSGKTLTFYQNDGYAGFWWTLESGQCWTDLRRITMGGVGNWNDKISSFTVY